MFIGEQRGLGGLGGERYCYITDDVMVSVYQDLNADIFQTDPPQIPTGGQTVTQFMLWYRTTSPTCYLYSSFLITSHLSLSVLLLSQRVMAPNDRSM